MTSNFIRKGIFMLLLCSPSACRLFQNPKREDLYSTKANYLKEFSENSRKKSPLDKREMKQITLPNKLDVLLISSKAYNKSAAAMDVAIGAFEDPKAHPGMAHFLEHMLFLGTKKYPSVDDYSDYLSTHQGYSNAYTDKENTNYHFEVNTNAFEGALDRFSEFFKEPLFSPKYVEREMNAVNSEHQNNIRQDQWRKHRVLGLSYHKDHPRQKFSTGNIDTLKKIKREDLIKFYQKQYSSNQMKLVLMSSLPLENMEKLAKEKFSGIKNSNRKDHHYSSQMFDTKSLPKEISIASIKDLRELDLVFPSPSNKAYWRSKPSHLITFLVGHEGKGSLLSLLKEQGYATGLSAWFEERSYGGLFHFKLELTEKGLRFQDDVIETFFSYIKLLQSQKLPSHIFDEIKKMADTEFVFKEHMEGTSVAAYYASKLQNFSGLELEEKTELFHEYNNDHFQKFLSYIKPSNLISLISTNKAKTNKTEKYYGAPYKMESISRERRVLWEHAGLEEKLALPPKNDYIPNDLALLKSEIVQAPRQILEQEEGLFWFGEDGEFKQPKAKVSILLETPVTSASPENKVKTILYQKSLEESLGEWRYQINLAGLDFHLAYHPRGLHITFEGYSQHLPKLMREVAEKLTNITISSERFETIKKDFVRGLENLKHEAAYQKVLYELNDLSKPYSIHYEEYYNPEKNLNLIANKKLELIKEFPKELFKKFSLEGLAYGNLEEGPTKEAALSYFKTLNAEKLPLSDRREDSSFSFKDGESYSLALDQKSSANFSWGRYVQFGKRDMKLNAILRITNSILQPDFYQNLRTENQLGYIVHSGLRYSEKTLGLLYLVQSHNYDPYSIESYFEKWEKNVIAKLESTSDQEIENLKGAVARSLREKDKTVSERHGTLYFEAITMKSSFNYKEKLAKVTEELTKKDILDFYKDFFSKNKKKSLTIYFDKEKQNKKLEEISKKSHLIENKSSYKESRSIY